MKKSWSTVRLADGKTRARTVLVYEPLPPDSEGQRRARYELLREVAEQPDLSHCQGRPFETLRMYWQGSAWVMELEAEIEEKQP